MIAIDNFWAYEEIARVRLSRRFYLRDFLFSEIGAWHRVPNIPEDLETVIAAGRGLCEHILEPLAETFGHVHIRSAYRSPRLNDFGNRRGLKCSRTEANLGYHCWGRTPEGLLGAAACIVIPWWQDRDRGGSDWQRMAWWLYDHLDFYHVTFFQRQSCFNIGWCGERPAKSIDATLHPRGTLVRADELPLEDHCHLYADFPPLKRPEPWQGQCDARLDQLDRVFSEKLTPQPHRPMAKDRW